MTTSTTGRRGIVRRAALLTAGALLATALAVGLSIPGGTSAPRPVRAFAWLQAAPAPPQWTLARAPSGAAFAYPPGWRRIHADSGEVSAAPAVDEGPFVGYLNATPQQGAETLRNWRDFRVAHNADEGSRGVRLEAAATGIRFRSGHGSCVIDSYSTSRERFREVACIVVGTRATSVIVGAAPVGTWARQAPTIERAVASFAT